MHQSIKFAKVSRRVIKELTVLAKNFCSKSVSYRLIKTDDVLKLTIKGMGLIQYMRDPLEGKFNEFLFKDFRLIAYKEDCFRSFDEQETGMTPISITEISVPSISFTYYVQQK